MPHLKIGELSKTTNVSVQTLRYYESLGLINPVKRSKGGYRYYNRTVADRIVLIKELKTIGFSLKEIKHLLELNQKDGCGCNDIKTIVTNKIQQVNREIEDLCCKRGELLSYAEEKLDECSHCKKNDRISYLVSDFLLNIEQKAQKI